jgi:hypothetical protein
VAMLTRPDSFNYLGYPGTNLSVNVISQRPGFDNIIIVAGVFASAGTLPCASICQWDSAALRWSSLSTGLSGIVGAVSFAGVSFLPPFIDIERPD